MPELSRLEFSAKFFREVFSKKFCFLECSRQRRVINYRWYGRFTFGENIISNEKKFTTSKFLGKKRLFCFMAMVTGDSIYQIKILKYW